MQVQHGTHSIPYALQLTPTLDPEVAGYVWYTKPLISQAGICGMFLLILCHA
jgi:hypothetical protein